MFSCACRTIFRLKPVIKPNIHCTLAATYKSNISLETLYPDSTHDPVSKHNVKTKSIPDVKDEEFSGVIPLNELMVQYCRSGGPGGQHVNKVNTKVEMRFNIDQASWIPEWAKPNLKEQQQNRVNKEGELIVTSQKTRKQILNQADCLEKIRHIVFQASVKPREITPEELALMKKREEAAKRRNIEEKRRRSLQKQMRQKPML